jgi:hypothetical protein
MAGTPPEGGEGIDRGDGGHVTRLPRRPRMPFPGHVPHREPRGSRSSPRRGGFSPDVFCAVSQDYAPGRQRKCASAAPVSDATTPQWEPDDARIREAASARAALSPRPPWTISATLGPSVRSRPSELRKSSEAVVSSRWTRTPARPRQRERRSASENCPSRTRPMVSRKRSPIERTRGRAGRRFPIATGSRLCLSSWRSWAMWDLLGRRRSRWGRR